MWSLLFRLMPDYWFWDRHGLLQVWFFVARRAYSEGER